ncbi:TPA: carbohydrate kinase family protein [Candidatus Nomurabacteria bacterium]|nr:MAG: Sugar kinase, ribokinase family [Parcubacteria bacterium RAAC4_OD1_1]HCY26604.1 carbohydrate kinase family protein [Candidatus Nomurabacteria bacterium]
MMDEKIDLLAIGDIATEPFIKIKEAKEECEPNGHCNLCLSFRDKIPYEEATICYAVGNSPNVSIGASRLGLNTYLVSYVGNDRDGSENINFLINENVKTDYIHIADGLSTNYHYVLWYNKDRTILVKHTDFPYVLPSDLKEPKWMYLSSLSSNSIEYHKTISLYLKNHEEVKFAFQPGTFQIKFGYEELKEIYERTDVFFCNKEEYQKILETKESDEVKLMKMMHKIGPKMLILTNSKDGAWAYNGENIWYIKALPGDPFEMTGAGDAFASGFISSLIMGNNIETSLLYGSINARSVIEEIGPHEGLLTKEEIEEAIEKIPVKFKANKIN